MMWKPNILREKISSNKIYQLLFDRFGAPADSKAFVAAITDKYFYLASEEEILEVIKNDDTETEQYVPEIGDCDNFAFELRAAFGRKGWPVGILCVETPFGLHAVFFYITDKFEVRVIEPQNDNPFNEVNSLIGVIMY